MQHESPRNVLRPIVLLIVSLHLNFKQWECGILNEDINLSAQFHFVPWSSWIIPWLGCYPRDGEHPPNDLSFASALSCHQNLCIKSLCFFGQEHCYSVIFRSRTWGTNKNMNVSPFLSDFNQKNPDKDEILVVCLFRTFHSVENEALQASYGNMKLI